MKPINYYMSSQYTIKTKYVQVITKKEKAN